MRSVARCSLIRCRRLRSASLWLRPRSFRPAGAGAGHSPSTPPSVTTISPPPLTTRQPVHELAVKSSCRSRLAGDRPESEASRAGGFKRRPATRSSRRGTPGGDRDMPGAGTAQSSGRAPTRGALPFCSGLAGWRQRRAPATTAVLAPGARWKRGSTAPDAGVVARTLFPRRPRAPGLAPEPKRPAAARRRASAGTSRRVAGTWERHGACG